MDLPDLESFDGAPAVPEFLSYPDEPDGSSAFCAGSRAYVFALATVPGFFSALLRLTNLKHPENVR
jgi:hypothetical protein